MSGLIWEEPPGRTVPEGFGRERTPLRKEADAMLAELQYNQGKWARLYLFETKDEARKRASFIGRKGYSFYVREVKGDTPGWAVFARYNGPVEDKADNAGAVAQPGGATASEPSASNDAVREGSFQV